MLDIISGNNMNLVREKAFSLVAQSEEKGFTLVRIDAENYVPGILKDALGSDSLFSEQFVYLIDTPSGNSDFKDEFWELLELFAVSAHSFIVIEGALLAAEKKKAEKYADTFHSLEETVPERYNMFALADALTARDKKKLWMLLQEARENGVSVEEILGILWWQIKVMRLASMTHSATEAGVSPFPYKKAKSALTKFSGDDLKMLSQNILIMYHDAHSGRADGYNALERFALSLT